MRSDSTQNNSIHTVLKCSPKSTGKTTKESHVSQQTLSHTRDRNEASQDNLVLPCGSMESSSLELCVLHRVTSAWCEDETIRLGIILINSERRMKKALVRRNFVTHTRMCFSKVWQELPIPACFTHPSILKLDECPVISYGPSVSHKPCYICSHAGTRPGLSLILVCPACSGSGLSTVVSHVPYAG